MDDIKKELERVNRRFELELAVLTGSVVAVAIFAIGSLLWELSA